MSKYKNEIIYNKYNKMSKQNKKISNNNKWKICNKQKI